jgi:hypothetical protein
MSAWFAFDAIGCIAIGLPAAALVGLHWRTVRQAHERRAMTALETARELLGRGHHDLAAEAASDAAAQARTSRTRAHALTTLAWAALEQGNPERAIAALDRIEPRHLDLYCYAFVQSARGKHQLAIKTLEVARGADSLSLDGAKLLVDLYTHEYGVDRAVWAAWQSRAVLGPENCRRVVRAACDAGAYGPAAMLTSALFAETCASQDAAALIRALAYGRRMGEVSRALHDAVGRLQRIDRPAQARSLVEELRRDRSLPSGTHGELDRALHALESTPSV